jgi:uncharacterized protein
MQRRDGHLVYSPGDLCRFFESPFVSWMDRLRVERPGTVEPDEPEAEQRLLAERGAEHERRHLDALRAAGKRVWEPPANLLSFREKHAATLGAMEAGYDVVYQAALRQGAFEGHADFLYRVDGASSRGRSRWGTWSYEVADTKLARSPKPYFLLQLCAYAKMLESMQRVRPERVYIVNGRGEQLSFRTDDYFFYFASLERRFLEAEATFDPGARPVPEVRADHGRWQSRADAILDELDHPSRVAGISMHQVRRLAAVGIPTLAALAATDRTHVPRIDDAIFARLRAQARLQHASRGKDVPDHEIVPHDSTLARFGFAMLPPASPMDVYFDMEGYPLHEGGLEYLFGATTVEGGAPRFHDFWAHDRATEKKAFEDFIDWAHARFRRDPSMHVYHYAAYEVSALRRLMCAHGTRESELDDLLRAEVFVDLYRVVRQTIRIGAPSYSLKVVERLYRGTRSGEVATAAQSLVEYARWIDHRDGDSWETSAILAGIRDYNRDDCESTWQLAEWLRGKQAVAGVAYVPPPKRDKAKEAARKEKKKASDTSALAERLLASAEGIDDPERRRVQELLAHLVGFHEREEKPVWWRVFDRRWKTHAELAEDADCLGGLERTATPRERVGESFLYEYRFPPQETKLGPERACFLSQTETLVQVTLAELDLDAGVAKLKLGVDRDEPPACVSLLPNDVVPATAIAKSIAGVAERWERTGVLPKALDTLLGRKAPRVAGVESGQPLLGETPTSASVTLLLERLEETTIAIQGPPGSGKTVVSAAAIVKLARGGKRIGISSNSHKAIQKLVEEVRKTPGGAGLRVTKVNAADDELEAMALAVRVKGMKEVRFDGADAPEIVAGTAWAFAAAEAAGRFDYLFVDEAGQVSLANLVGMSPAATNVVLVGDQMQLGQPILGAHPGESGTSALEYLLAGQRTVAAGFGVFLERTWRMHPELCRFVSGAIYEDKLTAEAGTAEREVAGGEGEEGVVRKGAGIVFVPVEHEGNTQASEEEVGAVVEVVRELRGRRLTGARGERAKRDAAVGDDDLLVVAPYNMQVRALRAALPGVAVGSVDKFQGQEAPVVIVSMAASDARAARGIEFLFSPNRLNVALSRAQSLAVVVGAPGLGGTRVSSVGQMKLVNLFCRVVEEGR